MTDTATTHKCPGPGCEHRLPRGKLMCPGHWRQVPRPLQSEVYASWNRGAGILSVRYAAARKAAIEAVSP